MQRKNPVLLALTALIALSLWGCGSNRDSDGVSSTAAEATAADPQALFVGSETCGTCHKDQYADFIESGHPFKLNKVVNDTVPSYPFSNIAGLLPNPDDGVFNNAGGEPVSYADISYVIGGYGWKARWVDNEGYIVTSDRNQYNLEDGSWSNYHADDVNKKYNCGNCHTTGWRRYDVDKNPNRQDDLPGMDGTFVEGGIHCESCHGPGAAHVASQDPNDIVLVAEARTTSDFLASDMGYSKAVACSECHTRDGEKDYPNYVSGYNQDFPAGSKEGGRILASGGLIKHHEQFDEMLGVDPDTGNELGKHLAANVTCVTCHDPHKTIKYEDESGKTALKVDCDSCHGVGEAFEVAMPADSEMADYDCTTCHMPNLAKSAIKHAAVGTGPVTGDIATHIFRIDLTKSDQFTADGTYSYPWITKDFACGTCHNGVDAFDVSAFDFSDYTFHKSTAIATLDNVDLTQFEGQFAGSSVCAECHETKYADFIQSGHPFKLNKVVNGQIPSYPFSDITGALEQVTDAGSDSRVDLLDGKAALPGNGTETDNELGTPQSYDEVTYVIGGYGWKARWIDADGFIVTGTEVQYNLEDGSMAGYHNDEANKVYNCGNCHTTGWAHFDAVDNPNRQDDLIGMDGTFVMEGGVHCESCHGAALPHVMSQDAADVTKVATARTTADFLAADMAYNQPVACGECHTRDGEKDYPTYLSGANNAGYTGDQGGRIVSNGTIAKHHEQYDELLGLDINADNSLGAGGPLGKHLNPTNGSDPVTCHTCHDPHKTTKYSATGALNYDCTSCHTVTFTNTGTTHANTDCISCHMPKLAKSAIWTGTNAAGKKLGDIKSHVFKIDLSKTDQLTTDAGFVYPRITPDYACGSCHSDTATKVGNLGGYGGTIHNTIDTVIYQED